MKKKKICYNLDKKKRGEEEDEQGKRKKKGYLSDHIFFIFEINGK